MVGQGTVLIFDDWYSFRNEDPDQMGERKAFREWHLVDCFEEFYDLPGYSKAFVMTRPDPEAGV